jgi:hypothetical protein
MNQANPSLVLPPDNTPVWRYLSLAKLLAMLLSDTVFFPRADQFEDHFEGALTERSMKEFQAKHGLDYKENLLGLALQIPKQSYVSCWHISAVESVALWKIYAGIEGSIAIQSTVGTLKKIFEKSDESKESLLVTQELRAVQYIDYQKQSIELNDLTGPLCYKRHAFAFEKELRIIRQEFITGPSRARPEGKAILIGVVPEGKGRSIHAPMNQLIHQISVAPSSPSWIRTLVAETLEKFGHDSIECKQSHLDELPEYGRFGT